MYKCMDKDEICFTFRNPSYDIEFSTLAELDGQMLKSSNVADAISTSVETLTQSIFATSVMTQ